MKPKLVWVFLTLIVMGLLSSAVTQEVSVSTFTIDNRGAAAFYLSSTEGIDLQVAELGADNASWTLTTGQRYHIINKGDAAYHPLELRGKAGVLLSQLEHSSSTFGTDEAVAFARDNEGMTFTLTSGLAQMLTAYGCAYHSAMTGEITVK